MNQFMLGEHNRAITELCADMEDVKRDVKAIRDLLAEQRGEKKAAVRFAGIAGAVVGALMPLGVKAVGLAVGVLRHT